MLITAWRTHLPNAAKRRRENTAKVIIPVRVGPVYSGYPSGYQPCRSKNRTRIKMEPVTSRHRQSPKMSFLLPFIIPTYHRRIFDLSFFIALVVICTKGRLSNLNASSSTGVVIAYEWMSSQMGSAFL